MLFCLLYHKVLLKAPPSLANSNNLALFTKHLTFIANNYTSCHPGDATHGKNNVCLTFDDATFDFFISIYPLLKKLNLKAVLAVPTAFPLDECFLSDKERLDLVAGVSFSGQNNRREAFCSWNELKQLAQSPLIHIASHSHTHQKSPNNIQEEIIHSKAILEKKLNQTITSFVYPFGNHRIYPFSFMHKHYKFLFRIGNAINKNWYAPHIPLYRISGDNLSSHLGPLSKKNKTAAIWRYMVKGINSFTKNKALFFTQK